MRWLSKQRCLPSSQKTWVQCLVPRGSERTHTCKLSSALHTCTMCGRYVCTCACTCTHTHSHTTKCNKIFSKIILKFDVCIICPLSFFYQNIIYDVGAMSHGDNNILHLVSLHVYYLWIQVCGHIHVYVHMCICAEVTVYSVFLSSLSTLYTEGGSITLTQSSPSELVQLVS